MNLKKILIKKRFFLMEKSWGMKEILNHEKRIALVNNFVCLVPLKNIVQGRKGYSKVEKRFPWESSFPLFYPWDRKVDFPGWKKASLLFQFLYGRK
jgi:hypothetical protein